MQPPEEITIQSLFQEHINALVAIMRFKHAIIPGVQKIWSGACAVRPKRLHAPDKEISQPHEDQSEQVLQVDLKKKGHGRLITAAMHVLLLGLGKFEHALEVNLQKKINLLLITVSMELYQGNAPATIWQHWFIHVCATNNFYTQLNSKKILMPLQYLHHKHLSNLLEDIAYSKSAVIIYMQRKAKQKTISYHSHFCTIVIF